MSDRPAPYAVVQAGPLAWKVVVARPVGMPEQVVAAFFAVAGVDPGAEARHLADRLNGAAGERIGRTPGDGR